MTKTRTVKIGNLEIGGDQFTLIAGPCSIESQEQFSQTAKHVKTCGAQALRGGMFKLRTQVHSFQGLGAEAYEIVRTIKTETGMPFISEITDPRQIGDFYDLVDAFQVGSRNMYNYSLLKELGAVNKPVVLKRGFSGLIKEWLHAAEYVLSAGNDNVILCERGIRTFETETRNTFDINAIAWVKAHSNLPILADPSHATGDAKLVTPISLAAAAAGADGLLIEVHPNPSQAKSDGQQTLNFDEFVALTDQLKAILKLSDRHL